MSGERYTLKITAERKSLPAIVRLRALLKVLHRAYGFRCDGLEQTDNLSGESVPLDASGATLEGEAR